MTRKFSTVSKDWKQAARINRSTASILLLFTRRGFLEGRDVLGVSRCGVSWSGVSCWGFIGGSFVIVTVIVLPVVLTVSGVAISPLDLFFLLLFFFKFITNTKYKDHRGKKGKTELNG